MKNIRFELTGINGFTFLEFWVVLILMKIFVLSNIRHIILFIDIMPITKDPESQGSQVIVLEDK